MTVVLVLVVVCFLFYFEGLLSSCVMLCFTSCRRLFPRLFSTTPVSHELISLLCVFSIWIVSLFLPWCFAQGVLVSGGFTSVICCFWTQAVSHLLHIITHLNAASPSFHLSFGLNLFFTELWQLRPNKETQKILQGRDRYLIFKKTLL